MKGAKSERKASPLLTSQQAQVNEADQNVLAERLALLETRLRMPSNHPQVSPAGKNGSDTLMEAALQSPTISHHSFRFDSPTQKSKSSINVNLASAAKIPTNTQIMTDNHHNNSQSNISLLSSSSANVMGSADRRRCSSSTLDVVNQAAEQHMQKIAALDKTLTGSNETFSYYLSSTSNQTLPTSHRATAAAAAGATNSNSSNAVVKETPNNNTAAKKELAKAAKKEANDGRRNPRVLAVTTDNTEKNQPKRSDSESKAGKRKSKPVKRDVSALRSRSNKAQTSVNANSKADDASRKRTRLFASSDSTIADAASNHSQPTILLSPTKTNSDSRSNPKPTTTSGTSSKQHKTLKKTN